MFRKGLTAYAVGPISACIEAKQKGTFEMSMKNAKEMREELSRLYDDLRAGKVEHKIAAELTNVCGKMISSSVAQVKYMQQRKEQFKIDFLDE